MASAERRKVFDGRLVRTFCQHTGDENKFHNPDWAGERGKAAIVPGLLVFSCFPLMDSIDLIGRRVDLRFGKFLSAGDEVSLVLSQGDSSYSLEVVGDEGDHFKPNGQCSTLSLGEVQAPSALNYAQTRRVSLPFNMSAVDWFQNALRIQERGVAGLFYSFSKVSEALFRLLNEPTNEPERDLVQKVSAGNVLAYKSLSLFPLNYPLLFDAGQLDFDIHYNAGQGREQGAFVNCFHGDCEVYRADLNLISLPEKVIVRAMKSI